MNAVLDLAARALDGAGNVTRLVELLRGLGPAASAAAALVGLVALTVAGRFPRGLAATGGAALGALAAYAFRAPLAMHVGVSLPVALPVVAIVAGAACALAPLAFPLAIGALPGLILGLQVPIAGRAALGGAVGALLGGLVALLFARPFATGFASALGALLAVAAAVGAGGDRPLARDLATHPLAIVAFALVLAIAGAAYQLARGDAAARAPAPRQPPPAA